MATKLTYQQRMAQRFERWHSRCLAYTSLAKFGSEVDIIAEWSWLYGLLKEQIAPLKDVADYDELHFRNELIDRAARILKDMAPYVRSRALSNGSNAHMAFDYSKLSDEELDALILVSGKLIEGKVD